jgi:hypothetical protein
MCTRFSLRRGGFRWAAACWLLLAVGCLGIAGCGKGPAVQLTGKLTVGGEPAEGATVILHPAGADIGGVRPAGTTDAGGNFSLTTAAGESIPAGDYTVTVVWMKSLGSANKPGERTTSSDERFEDRLKGRYATPQKSDLRINVAARQSVLQPIELPAVQ